MDFGVYPLTFKNDRHNLFIINVQFIVQNKVGDQRMTTGEIGIIYIIATTVAFGVTAYMLKKAS